MEKQKNHTPHNGDDVAGASSLEPGSRMLLRRQELDTGNKLHADNKEGQGKTSLQRYVFLVNVL